MSWEGFSSPHLRRCTWSCPPTIQQLVLVWEPRPWTLIVHYTAAQEAPDTRHIWQSIKLSNVKVIWRVCICWVTSSTMGIALQSCFETQESKPGKSQMAPFTHWICRTYSLLLDSSTGSSRFCNSHQNTCTNLPEVGVPVTNNLCVVSYCPSSPLTLHNHAFFCMMALINDDVVPRNLPVLCRYIVFDIS
jgi:hypothetical protein